MDNISKIFQTNVRITKGEALARDSVWPHGIELCITRIPIRKRDGYSIELIQELGAKLKSNMVQNGVVFLICYAPTEAKFRPFEIAAEMVRQGFTHIDNIIIEKSWYPGKRSEVNLVNSHEYVMHFCNGKVWRLDREPIRSYLKTDEEITCPGNTWKVRTGSLDEAYPLDLAELLLRMTDLLPGSIVIDPFMSTTSGLIASLKLGHTFWGFEKDQKKLNRYEKITKDFKKYGQKALTSYSEVKPTKEEEDL